MNAPSAQSSLFRHVSADNAAVYRALMEAFAAAKRQFRMHLRPDEVRAEAEVAHEGDQAVAHEEGGGRGACGPAAPRPRNDLDRPRRCDARAHA